jgi:hypothetical protein
MARSLWSDRPLGVNPAVLGDAVATATGSTTRAMNDAQAAIDEVARMATSLHSSVAEFRY